ncbi:SDR family NAD(P)-dependent oxidoreductase [Streptomyces sp. SP18CS02]|uniref:SDR family NAD(P)-dependent oxidoreductase n=1 Tax=Streptomyces sp. SP18CS02 TaxID=3002531 RepID=UPI002E7A4378|nr:SDR family NAD(P)-dependent oxidoreductase [Streptomyces sp. SP18CS02]MEE1752119.1 SDR family NAD(P)-dependent oxidoreductase [Streptomyces sp. SP18CS02]
MGTALVTGASYGIGADIARALAARGHDLILVARGAESLDRLAADLAAVRGVRARTLPADLTDGADLERVASAAYGADILVNNAGAGLGRSFERTRWADEQRMLDLNVVAPARLIHAALPAMLRRGDGRILNVSSVAAAGPVWQGTSYGAAKAFGLALTESLAYTRLLRASPVALTALVLGHTTSQFHERAGIPPSPPLLTLASPYVAERAVRAIHRRRPPVTCVPSLRYKLLAGLLRHTPRRLLALPGLADDFTTAGPGADRPAAADTEAGAAQPVGARTGPGEGRSVGADGEYGVLPAETRGHGERQP